MIRDWLNRVGLLQVCLVMCGLAGEATRYAFAWWVLKVTGSAGQFGAVLTVSTIAGTIARLLAGAISDHVGPIRLLKLAIGAQALLGVTLATWTYIGSFNTYLAFLVLGAMACAGGAVETTSNVALAALAPAGAVTETMARRGSLSTLSKFLGPMLAGVLLTALGPSWTLLAGACACTAGWGVVTFRLNLERRSASPNKKVFALARKWLTDSGQGVVAFSKVRVDLLLCLMTCGINLGLPGFFLVVLPYLILHVKQAAPTVLGTLDALFCLGMFIGGTRTVKWLNARVGKTNAIMVSITILAAMLIVCATSSSFPVWGATMFIGGCFMLSIFANVTGLRAVATPESYRGRMFSAAGFLNTLSIGPGLALTTVLLETFGYEVALVVSAAIMLASVATIYFIPNASAVLAMPEAEAKNAYERLYPQAFKRS